MQTLGATADKSRFAVLAPYAAVLWLRCFSFAGACTRGRRAVGLAWLWLHTRQSVVGGRARLPSGASGTLRCVQLKGSEGLSVRKAGGVSENFKAMAGYRASPLVQLSAQLCLELRTIAVHDALRRTVGAAV